MIKENRFIPMYSTVWIGGKFVCVTIKDIYEDDFPDETFFEPRTIISLSKRRARYKYGAVLVFANGEFTENKIQIS